MWVAHAELLRGIAERYQWCCSHQSQAHSRLTLAVRCWALGPRDAAKRGWRQDVGAGDRAGSWSERDRVGECSARRLARHWARPRAILPQQFRRQCPFDRPNTRRNRLGLR